MRFYLDESLSDEIAVAARRLGIDVTSSHAVGNDGGPDDVQLAYATRAGRCIVTTNYAHFSDLARAYAERGELHAGILLLPRSLPPVRDNFGAIARALHHYGQQHADEIYPHVDWLYPVPDP